MIALLKPPQSQFCFPPLSTFWLFNEFALTQPELELPTIKRGFPFFPFQTQQIVSLFNFFQDDEREKGQDPSYTIFKSPLPVQYIYTSPLVPGGGVSVSNQSPAVFSLLIQMHLSESTHLWNPLATESATSCIGAVVDS